MIASDLSDALNAVAATVAAVSVLTGVLVVGKRLRHISADVKGVKLQVDTELPDVKKVLTEQVAKPLKEVNTAVNHRAPHEPTLVERVTALERLPEQLNELRDQQTKTAEKVEDLWKSFDQFAKATTELQSELIRVVGVEVTHLKTTRERT